jgi:hypothetical protein
LYRRSEKAYKREKGIVVPENPIDVEITELVRVVFFGHVCDLALIAAIL